ncbi:DUF3313 domain-containing protein [Paraburkholderia lacunae]|uniref:DUF3313 domain-containing protein n=1 Tax=Paraburkholderia lacunae TaxID=2211104 RepID=A0A370N5F7_9BURK|nr:DUF3313 domain-containing protein [Paraburkholderia lacunae]RDK00822.1 DUF3313 domain-containing protein [Paraburkholderia lacunae]
MVKSVKARHLLIAAICTALIGCSSVPPVAYSGIPSSTYLRPNTQDDSTRVPYRFAPQTDWQKYTRLIIDPVTVYQGADNQFGDMHDEDKAVLASYMQSKFAEKLRGRFQLANEAGPNTLRLKLVLTGAKTNTPVLSAFTHFDIGGNLYNGVQAVRGREGAFMGSVIYAVEIYDASSNRLLSAYVTKQYPNPFNLGASFSSLSASKTGIDKGADALVAQFK